MGVGHLDPDDTSADVAGQRQGEVLPLGAAVEDRVRREFGDDEDAIVRLDAVRVAPLGQLVRGEQPGEARTAPGGEETAAGPSLIRIKQYCLTCWTESVAVRDQPAPFRQVPGSRGTPRARSSETPQIRGQRFGLSASATSHALPSTIHLTAQLVAT
jgi:hypothetical protein